MINPFTTEVSFISESSNGNLEGYPKSDVKSIVFDAADASIDVYVEQFRYFLGACGFCEKSIVEVLGEQ
jgi:hypothetical protein